jgi:hypothetical protein
MAGEAGSRLSPPRLGSVSPAILPGQLRSSVQGEKFLCVLVRRVWAGRPPVLSPAGGRSPFHARATCVALRLREESSLYQ